MTQISWFRVFSELSSSLFNLFLDLMRILSRIKLSLCIYFRTPGGIVLYIDYLDLVYFGKDKPLLK